MVKFPTINKLIQAICKFTIDNNVILWCDSFVDGIDKNEKRPLQEASLDSQLSFLYGKNIFSRILQQQREILLFSRYENYTSKKSCQGWKNVETTLNLLTSEGKFVGDRNWYSVHRATIMEAILKELPEKKDANGKPRICLIVDQFRERILGSIQKGDDDFKNSFVAGMAEYLCNKLNIRFENIKNSIIIIALIAIGALISIEITVDCKQDETVCSKVKKDIQDLKTYQSTCETLVTAMLQNEFHQDSSAAQTLGYALWTESHITQQTQKTNRIIPLEKVSTFSDLKCISLESWGKIINSVLIDESVDDFFNKIDTASWEFVYKRLRESVVYQNIAGMLYRSNPQAILLSHYITKKIKEYDWLPRTNNKMSYVPLEECLIHRYIIIPEIIKQVKMAPEYNHIESFFQKLAKTYKKLIKDILDELGELPSETEIEFLDLDEWKNALRDNRSFKSMEQFNLYMEECESSLETDLNMRKDLLGDVNNSVDDLGGVCSVITWLLLKRIAIMDRMRSVIPGNEKYEEFLDIMRSYYRNQLQSIKGDPIGIISNEPEDVELKDIISSTSKHDI